MEAAEAAPEQQDHQDTAGETLEAFLRFRLTYIDTVQSSPLALPPAPTTSDPSTPFVPARRIPFAPSGSNLQIERIPEVRIFGATEAGQRCCIHVHGAMPYLYVEYEGKVAPDEVHNYINRLARTINVCMAASLGRRDPAKSLFVAFIVPVKAVPFYGFHVGYRYFLKIYTLDPKYMTRLATLLRSGEIMKKNFIVYESHIPFLLQFMLDANLYGCGWVDVHKAKFREPVPEDVEPDSSAESAESIDGAVPMAAQTEGRAVVVGRNKARLYTRSTIPASMLYGDPVASPSRVAHSELEFDIHVSWILNRHLVKERNLHADFTEYLANPIPEDFKFVHSVRELWEDEKRRRKQKGLDGPMEISENSAEELLGGLTAGPRSMDPDARKYGIGSQPPWKSFDENSGHFENLVEKDKLSYAGAHPNKAAPDFETFARKEKKGGWMEKIKTSFQSVEALFEETMERDEAEGNPFGAWGVRGIGVAVSSGKGKEREKTLEPDVNPHYLALLGTQAGRAKLQKMEDEDAKLNAVTAEYGLDEHNVPSDEEEMTAEETKREMEEEAKARVNYDGLSRTEAWEAEEAELRRASTAESTESNAMYGNAPMAGQKPGLNRRSRSADSRDESERSRSTESASTEGDQSSEEVPDGRHGTDENDPDIALLNQLVPVYQEDDEADMTMQLDNSPPTPPPASRYTSGVKLEANGIEANGRKSASAMVKSQTSEQKEKLREAGFSDLSELDLDSELMLQSSPDKARPFTPGPSQPMSSSGIYSPRKRKQTESPEKPNPFASRASSTSAIPKKVSPAKVNYFSPAKSKLRNAVVNPNFVAESKAKRNREEQMIGFRAIGDHGRTKLQQMLNVTRQPKLKAERIGDGKVRSAVAAERDQTAHDGQPPAKKRRQDLDLSTSSSEGDEWPDKAMTPMHIVLSSAGTPASQTPTNCPMSIHDLPTQSTDGDVADTDGATSPEVGVGNGSSAKHKGTPPRFALTPLEATAPVYAPSQLPQERESGKKAPVVDTLYGQGSRTTQTPAKPAQDPAAKRKRGNLTLDNGDSSLARPASSDLGTIARDPIRPSSTTRNVRFASVVVQRGKETVGDGEQEDDEHSGRMDDEEARDEEVSTSDDSAVEEDDDEDKSTRERDSHFRGGADKEERQIEYEHEYAEPTVPLTPTSSISARRTSSSQARTSSKGFYRLTTSAPTFSELLQDLDSVNLPHKLYQDAYWSNATDVPTRAVEFAGRRIQHRSDAARFLPEFSHSNYTGKRFLLPIEPISGFKKWEYAMSPPSRSTVLSWSEGTDASSVAVAAAVGPKLNAKGGNRIMDTQWAAKSQIQGPTQANPFGAKYAQVKPTNAVVKEKEHMSSLAIEIHVNTREGLLPDPAKDPIQAVFYCFQNEDDHIPDNGRKEGTHCGIIITKYEGEDPEVKLDFRKLGMSRYTIQIVDDELDLVMAVVDKVREWDPEIFTGFDVLKDSWGYFVERVDDIAPELDIVMDLSRVRSQSTGKRGGKNEDRWGYSKGATLKITGRHILPIWRLLKSDINLCMYSFENVVFHLLRQRVPRFSPATLTSWFRSGKPFLVTRTLQYHMLRAQLVIELLDEAEIVSRNAEFARVFGVDFYSVLTRGSQFKVESVMFKISKPENFMLPSPSREDVGKQNAATCMPLILEPESGFYSSPVLIFDFQSLYPSVMIAYNLCYSTCLGRLQEFLGTNRLGTSSLAIPKGALTLLKDQITLSPNGLMFLKPQVRRSLISKMLTEILDTRVMIKKSMKLVDENDKALSRLLNARQLGLKFIANVTYGYTSATFSGRMPCVEIADAIVQTGRETLERAKHTIQSRPDWGAIVRYGDTDSLFVHLPGKTKDEAFTIGNDIAETITKLNPKPVKLKFEKVYLPCFLLAKKRYVGFKFESQKDVEPEFDAKGIETVRRDGFPAMQKMVEMCIKIMFRTSNLSAVKLYVQQQFSRIMQNRSSAQDFIYAKEVKMGSYSDKGTPPPGAVVTGRRMLVDPRTEALYGERVPYLISKGIDGPSMKQALRALTPEEFLFDRENALDDIHYIGRVVKALNRLFNLVGVDVQEWYNSTPRRKVVGKPGRKGSTSRIRVDQHFSSIACPICGANKPSTSKLCPDCLSDPVGTTLSALNRQRHLDGRVQAVKSVCSTCSKLPAIETDACDSIDCPTLYSRIKVERDLEDVSAMLQNLLHISRKQQEPYIIF